MCGKIIQDKTRNDNVTECWGITYSKKDGLKQIQVVHVERSSVECVVRRVDQIVREIRQLEKEDPEQLIYVAESTQQDKALLLVLLGQFKISIMGNGDYLVVSTQYN